ncbi:MAG: mechanosensitive ion channel [Bacteroidales bacterium]|nr:mechanosensitive ion channel [Bacteroidales bacterium]
METLKSLLDTTIIQNDDYKLTVYGILISVLILVFAGIVVRILKRVFRKQEQQKRIEIGKSRSIFLVLRYIIWIGAIFAALNNIGFKLTVLLAGSAALLVGLGLALQQIFQDLMCGITLIIEGTIKVGDIVQTDDGQVGIVRELDLRTSKLETRDNIIHIVPNSKLINNKVINWSHNEQRTRFNIAVGVAYGSDVQLVKKTLLECAINHPKVSKKPVPMVLFKNFGDSSLDFELLFYTADTFYVEFVKSDLRFAIDESFRTKDITIPFPQRDVYLKK